MVELGCEGDIMRSYSPLRYPGGKGQKYKYVLNILEDNQMFGCNYIEPYAGGAGLAIRLLFENKVNSIHLNDFDRSIYAFWYSVINNTEEFIERIDEIEVNIDSYYMQKEIQKNKNDHSLIELGFSTFFLNRTNRSGIIKAGPIGGYAQNGNYLIDCRFNKAELKKIINQIGEYRQRITIDCMDGAQFVKKTKGANSFYFIDPPYYDKGEGLYTNYFVHDDHLNLANVIKEELSNQNYIISYDNCSEIKEMYKYLRNKEIGLRYSLENKVEATEIWFASDSIIF